MERWVRRCASFEEEERADLEFWAEMSPDQRVEVLEAMRRQEAEANGEHFEGLRRAVRVLERPWG